MTQIMASLKLIDNKVMFEGRSRDNNHVTLDYFPPIGEGKGYTGLELLMISLAGCSATSIVSMLRKMKKDITDFKVEVTGDRKECHPTVLTRIMLKFTLISTDTNKDELERVISLSEETYCPVWAMLKPTCEIQVASEILLS
ncbi:hypothetical protein APF79_11660 [bacterium BRH_c32]|nr:MAG: hypothetical protein APF79_11660 [bacterium BRH_c32]